MLELSSANLGEISSEIRKLCYAKVSYDVKEEGLVVALQRLLETIRVGAAVDFDVDWQEEALGKLSGDQQLHLYRIIQECINNVLKHAEASRAEIILSEEKEMIHLIVRDNGKGCPGKGVSPGIGLSNMLNRVKLLSGELFIKGIPGEGTSVVVRFPIMSN